jgi:hypothetical protein
MTFGELTIELLSLEIDYVIDSFVVRLVSLMLHYLYLYNGSTVSYQLAFAANGVFLISQLLISRPHQRIWKVWHNCLRLLLTRHHVWIDFLLPCR